MEQALVAWSFRSQAVWSPNPSALPQHGAPSPLSLSLSFSLFLLHPRATMTFHLEQKPGPLFRGTPAFYDQLLQLIGAWAQSRQD